jgi:transcriptional antiterminator
MPAKDKIHRYLETHKRPVTVDKLAKHFLLTKRTVQQALKELTNESRAARIGISRPALYCVAIPPDRPSLKAAVRPTANKRWSIYDEAID